MSDSLLVKTNDGQVHLVQGRAKEGGVPSKGDALAGDKAGRNIQDVVDLSVGARLAAGLRNETDPTKLADALQTSRDQVTHTTGLFASLLGRAESASEHTFNSIRDLFKEILLRTQRPDGADVSGPPS